MGLEELAGRVRRLLCYERSTEAGDPPCWQCLPDAYRESDCEAGCLRDAEAIARARAQDGAQG